MTWCAIDEERVVDAEGGRRKDVVEDCAVLIFRWGLAEKKGVQARSNDTRIELHISSNGAGTEQTLRREMSHTADRWRRARGPASGIEAISSVTSERTMIVHEDMSPFLTSKMLISLGSTAFYKTLTDTLSVLKLSGTPITQRTNTSRQTASHQ